MGTTNISGSSRFRLVWACLVAQAALLQLYGSFCWSKPSDNVHVEKSPESLKQSELKTLHIEVNKLRKTQAKLLEDIKQLQQADSKLEEQLVSTRFDLSASNISPPSKQSTSNPPYAYVFVVGGCDPHRPSYRNYLYNILLSTHLLRKYGSKADVVAFFQLSHKSNHTRLLDQEERWFNQMGVKYQYIPKSPTESFYEITLHKFRILGLTQYRRVIFMDADVMPLNSMDYLFELSEKPNSIVQPNLILAGSMEPANGGFFMFEPTQTALDDISRIVHRRTELGKNASNKDGFDKYIGWGHSIVEPDFWESNREIGQNWTFHAPHGMQGLLYYYAKYVRQNVTIVLANRAQKWTSDARGEPVRMEELKNPFTNFSSPEFSFQKCGEWTRGKGCPPPYSDFFHFSGKGKPWMSAIPDDLFTTTATPAPAYLWWRTLALLNDQLSLGINFQNWTGGLDEHRPLLGMVPTKWSAKTTVIDFGKADTVP